MTEIKKTHIVQEREHPTDDFTFGNSPAEVTLAKLLDSSDDGVRSFVTKLLARISEHGYNLQYKNPKLETKKVLYHMFRKHFNDEIDDSISLNRKPEIKTFLKNAAVKRLRKIFGISTK